MVSNCDGDFLTLTYFPEVLPVTTKPAVTKCISMEEDKQAQNCAHSGITLICTRNGTNNELWYSMPYHLRSNNTSEDVTLNALC